MNNRKRAFTIVELLVALVILGVVSGLTIAALASATRHGDPSQTTEALLRVARETRITALTNAETLEVWLNPGSAEYITISHEGGIDRPSTEGHIPLDQGTSLSARAPRVRWIWRSDGGADADTLFVNGAEGGTAEIVINPFTGEASVARP